MRYVIAKASPMQVRRLCRRLGYREGKEDDGTTCFKKRLGDKRFPRFHMFVNFVPAGVEIDLHLDQESSRHIGNHNKAWAYEGPLVKKEMKKLARIYDSMLESAQFDNMNSQIKKKKGLFEFLFSYYR